MRQKLAILLVIMIGGFFLGMLVNARRVRADGDGLIHIYNARDLQDHMGKNDSGAKVAGRVVGFACQTENQGPIPVSGRGPCLVVTQEQ